MNIPLALLKGKSNNNKYDNDNFLKCGCRIQPSNECAAYDIKQSYGEAPVMLELWVMPSTPSLTSLPDPF